MSQTSTITLNCPICKRDHAAKIWHRIDVNVEKDAAEKLLKGEFFRFTCPDCGYESELHYSCLYVDRDIRLIIYLAGDHESDALGAEQAAAQAAEDIPFWKTGDSLLRIVHSAEELKEKLMIFDNGLDDRLVEICKGLSISQFPSDDNFYVTNIRYDVIQQQEVLRLTCSDETEQYVLDFDGFYKQIYEQYNSLLPPMRGACFNCVDLDYAAALMREMQEQM